VLVSTTSDEIPLRARAWQNAGHASALGAFLLLLYRGDALALIGGNGSGKSTALRLIAGVYEPTMGAVETRGVISAIIDLGVGFHPELTGLENVAQHAAIMGLSKRRTAERMDEILAFADIGDFVQEPIKYYSSGMQARLAFAKLRKAGIFPRRKVVSRARSHGH
jgi:lipopolysaccharide transport system ATP-binding protein